MPLVEQELPILPEHPSLPPDFSRVRMALIICFLYDVLLTSLIVLSFYILAIVISVFRITASDYPYDIYSFFLNWSYRIGVVPSYKSSETIGTIYLLFYHYLCFFSYHSNITRAHPKRWQRKRKKIWVICTHESQGIKFITTLKHRVLKDSILFATKKEIFFFFFHIVVTAKSLLFVGYKFSWFSWVGWSTKLRIQRKMKLVNQFDIDI